MNHHDFFVIVLTGNSVMVEVTLRAGYRPPQVFSSLGSALECCMYLKYRHKYAHLLTRHKDVIFGSSHEYDTIMTSLLTYGVSPNESKGRDIPLSALDLAIYNFDVEAVKLLIHHNADVNWTTRDLSPLTIARCQLSIHNLMSNKIIVTLLRDAGANDLFGFESSTIPIRL